MSNGKILTYLGILIAVNSAFWSIITIHWWVFLIVSCSTLLICVLLSYAENRIVNSNNKWLDKIVYKFNKNEFSYIVKQKIVEYSIESEREAKYRLEAKIKLTKTPEENFHYNGRYVWDQEEEIDINLINKNEFSKKVSENLKWTNVDIYPQKQLPGLNTEYSVGFTLDNLKIRRLIKHSYLSCKVIEKIEKLKLIAKVNPELHPSEKAILEIQNHLGMKIAEDEVIYYDTETKSYSKTLTCPRKGRKYIIHWEYEKSIV